MTRIFISYRRDDSDHITGRIYDRLCGQFGEGSVFIDIDGMQYGVDFREQMAQALAECRVLLAVIGDSWLDARWKEGPRAGQRRLEDEADPVRVEIESALARNVPVIPVLTGKAQMPREEELPEGRLRALAYCHAAEVRSGRDFEDHVARLVRGLERLVPGGRRRPPLSFLWQFGRAISISLLLCLAVAGSVTLVGHLLNLGPPADGKKMPGPVTAKARVRIRLAEHPGGEKWAAKLAKEADFTGIDDPKATLMEVLEMFAKKYDLAFDVDERAFRAEQLNDVARTEIANPRLIPAMKAPAGEILQKVLDRVPVPTGARYQVGVKEVMITTTQFLAVTIEETVEKVPLTEFLDQVEDAFRIKIDRGKIKDRLAFPIKVVAVTDVHLRVVVERALRQAELELSAIDWDLEPPM